MTDFPVGSLALTNTGEHVRIVDMKSNLYREVVFVDQPNWPKARYHASRLYSANTGLTEKEYAYTLRHLSREDWISLGIDLGYESE